MFDFDIIDKVKEETLVKTIKMVLSPPVKKVEITNVYTKGQNITPQPADELLDLNIINKKLNFNKSEELFLAVDQVISLLPSPVLDKLKRKLDLELFMEWKSNVQMNAQKIKTFNIDQIKSEDDKKRNVLMILPTEAQLSMIKGKWVEYFWQQKTYDGSAAPDWGKWFEEYLNLIEMLHKEGIKVAIAIDEAKYESLKPKIKADKVIPVKMPKNLLAIGYSRDQSLTLYKDPIILNMVLERRGEETVLNEIYYKMGIPPPVRSRWSLIGQNFVKIKIEGGNIFVIRTEKGVILLTGIGERGTNWAGLKFFSDILPREIRIIGVPLSSYIKDWFTSAFHLDLAFSFLGNTKKGMMALIDPEKIGLSSSIELDRKTGLFKLVNLLEVFKDNRVFVDEPPKEGQSKITAMNAFNLGNQKVMSDYLNKKVNDYIEKNFGIQVLRVKIPQLEAGGGGIRCSTREYWD